MGGNFGDNRLVVRCRTHPCGKILGVVDESGRLVTQSKRKGWYIKTEMEKGRITCTNCGTVLEWNAFSAPRANPIQTNALKETSHA
ncbi:hypothetical protein LCGC14_1965590 [marine sediment metagenome]|uniref:Uncharacterized protein n=1 Tax=marine sediment metagenome TaxID=412755 RepID=A0A0F9IAB7_9ZZZZ